MNKKGAFFPLLSVVGVGIRQCFVFTPKGEGKRTDISASTGAKKMIFSMNTNRPPSSNMMLS